MDAFGRIEGTSTEQDELNQTDQVEKENPLQGKVFAIAGRYASN